MLNDKITQELKARFSIAIESTRKTGNEDGFYIHKDLAGNLSPGKTYYGDSESVWMDVPVMASPDEKIQGNFHTKTLFRAAYLETRQREPSLNKIRDVAVSQMKKRYQDIGIDGMTSLNTPTYDDALHAIIDKFEGRTNGTVCVGNDFDEGSIECWTVNKVITKEIYDKASAENKYRHEQEKSGHSPSPAIERWALSLFERETIDLNSIENPVIENAIRVFLRPNDDFSIIPNKRCESVYNSKVNFSSLMNKPLSKGDIISLQHENETVELIVDGSIPEGTVIPDENTRMQIVMTFITNTRISPEHENNVLGRLKKAQKELQALIKIDYSSLNENEPGYDVDYLKAINPLTEIVAGFKKFEEEVTNLQKIVKKEPNDVLARFDLALRLNALSRCEDAEEQYNRALTLAPSNDVLHASYGNFLASIKFHYTYAAPVKEFKAAIELEPSNIEYRFMLANFYLKMSSFREAHEIFNQIVELSPQDARAYGSLGHLYLTKYKDYEKALKFIKRYIELAPDDYSAYYSLGQIYCRLKRFNDAKKEFEIYKIHTHEGMSVEECIRSERDLMEKESDENCYSCNIG